MGRLQYNPLLCRMMLTYPQVAYSCNTAQCHDTVSNKEVISYNGIYVPERQFCAKYLTVCE